MQCTQITPELKAFLISTGSVSVDPSLIARDRGGSTAGPGAGTSSVFFRAGDKRVRLSVNKNSPFPLKRQGGMMEQSRFCTKEKNLSRENLNLPLHTVRIRLL